MIAKIIRILIGTGVSPRVVALARGALAAAALAALQVVAANLTAAEVPLELGWILPVAGFLIRALEGPMDERRSNPPR